MSGYRANKMIALALKASKAIPENLNSSNSILAEDVSISNINLSGTNNGFSDLEPIKDNLNRNKSDVQTKTNIQNGNICLVLVIYR